MEPHRKASRRCPTVSLDARKLWKREWPDSEQATLDATGFDRARQLSPTAVDSARPDAAPLEQTSIERAYT